MSPYTVVARNFEHRFVDETQARRLVVKERVIAKYTYNPYPVELFHYGKLVALW